MKRESIKILINGCAYDEVEKVNHILGSIFMNSWEFYHIMSIDAIKQHMVAAIELIEEMHFEKIIKLTTPVNRTIKIMQGMIDNVKKKESFLSFISNIVLAKEGLGLLPGYGCAIIETNEGRVKIKSRLFINPEKQSIRQIY